MNKQKNYLIKRTFGKKQRILAIHDLSGHSHTSLMAVIPIMQTMGIAVTALPTAVLSSNTEQEGFVMADLTSHLESFLLHWFKLKLKFDAIYSGFLSSEKQLSIVRKAIGLYSSCKPLVVVDPVMAEDGKLYPCFSKRIIKSMQKLIHKADLVTPNLTEAAFLLNEKYQPKPDLKTVKNWCLRLAEAGPGLVIITNVPVKNNPKQTSVICYDKPAKTFHRKLCPYLGVSYPGAGDIFTCVLTALLLKGTGFFRAADQTVDFVTQAMELTIKQDTPPADGIALEQALKFLPQS
jgi:pyridoxine kinase